MHNITPKGAENKMVRLAFTLSPTHVKKVKEISRKMGITVSDFLRRCIDDTWSKRKLYG